MSKDMIFLAAAAVFTGACAVGLYAGIAGGLEAGNGAGMGFAFGAVAIALIIGRMGGNK